MEQRLPGDRPVLVPRARDFVPAGQLGPRGIAPTLRIASVRHFPQFVGRVVRPSPAKFMFCGLGSLIMAP